MPTVRRRPYGPSAWLVEDVESPSAWAAALVETSTAGIIEVVPAESTVVVRCDRAVHTAVGAVIDAVVAPPTDLGADDPICLDVVYDGADLADLAGQTGLSIEEIVELHAGRTYRVGFCGFSPGFAYLTGLDVRLRLPRRASPRVMVPAGSVAIAAGYTAVYPSASPGGWHLIGSTPAPVWDVRRTPPALLAPGRTVRFRPTDR